ncbi:MAG TPA: hypothetical protein VEY67_11570, partial [Candidatus Dormibacteraeota bacterium]|nr:hypothetical protein [Candidatus Dormibacteraeota bacterium]
LRLSRLVTRRFVRYVARVRAIADDDEPEDDAPEADAPEAGHVPEVERALEEPIDAEPDPEPPVSGVPEGPIGELGASQAESAGEPLRLTMPADPTLLSYLLAGIVELDLPHRQALLEADSTDERLIDLANVLAREVAFLEQRLKVYTPDALELADRRN